MDTAKSRLPLAGELESEVIGDETYWCAPGGGPPATKRETAYLLPNYDEYLVGYADRAAAFDGAHAAHLDARGNVLFENTLVVNGQVVGTWKRTLTKTTVQLALRLFAPLTAAQTKAVDAAVARYSAFVGRPVTAA